MRPIVRSEWIKFRSLRSSWVFLAITMLVLLGSGIVMSIGVGTGKVAPADLSEDPLAGALAGLGSAEILVAALAVLLVTGEYSTRTISLSLTVVPRRWPVLLAKAAVAAGAAFAAGLGPVSLAYFGGRLLMGEAANTVAVTSSVLRALLGAGLYLAVLAVIATGLGWLVRSTTGALAAFAGLFYVLPIITLMLPQRTSETVSAYLPGNAGGAVMQLTGGVLAPWTGFGLFVAYAVLILMIAAMVLRHRDVP